MERTVRIENTERFQFSPEGGATVASESAPAGPEVDVSVDAPDAPDTSLGDLPSVDNPDVDISDGDSPETSTSDTGSDNGSTTVVPSQPDVVPVKDGGDVEGEPKDETGGYVREPAVGGGTVTIVTEDNEGDFLGRPKTTQVVSASSDNIPIRDGVPPSDHSSADGSSNDVLATSRISGTASLTGLTGGGGTSGSSGGGNGGSSGSSGGSPSGSIPGYSGGGSGGSSGGGSSGGAPTGNPGGGGVV